MRKVLLSLLLGMLAVPLVAQEYQLVFADEFDGNGRPDSTIWGYEQGFAVTGGELAVFAVASVLPDGSHCMDDEFCPQGESGGDSNFTRSDPADLFSFRQEFLSSCSSVDGRICSVGIDGVGVGCVHDGIRADFCNIISDDLKRHGFVSFLEKQIKTYSIIPEKVNGSKW